MTYVKEHEHIFVLKFSELFDFILAIPVTTI